MRYVDSRLLRSKHKVCLGLACSLPIAKRLVSYILFLAVGNNHLRDVSIRQSSVDNAIICVKYMIMPVTLRSASCFSARSICTSASRNAMYSRRPRTFALAAAPIFSNKETKQQRDAADCFVNSFAFQQRATLLQPARHLPPLARLLRRLRLIRLFEPKAGSDVCTALAIGIQKSLKNEK